MDREFVFSRLADLARRDLEIDIHHAEQGIHEEWIDRRKNKLRADLEAGLEFFATFSPSVLTALHQDMAQQGPLSRTARLSLNDGNPDRPKRPNQILRQDVGIAGFISNYRAKHSSERFIRDFLMFPHTWPIIEAVYEALNLFDPQGLAEAADQYSHEAIERLLSIEEAIYQVQWEQARKLTKAKGYAYGDDMAWRAESFAHTTTALADYVLTETPTDEELAARLTRKPVNGFAVPLPGITRDEMLNVLQRSRKNKGPHRAPSP